MGESVKEGMMMMMMMEDLDRDSIQRSSSDGVHAAMNTGLVLAEGTPSAGEIATYYAPYFLPIVLYAGFTVFRSVNPKAKVSDYVFIVAAAIIIGNIFSIAVLRTRLF